MKMSKIEMLFVRACKSMERKRVYSVYRRFYMNSDKKPEVHIANILMNICDKYYPIDPMTLMADLCPANRWRYWYAEDGEYKDGPTNMLAFISSPSDYWTVAMRVLISHIRLAPIKPFVEAGHINPAWSRKRDEENNMMKYNHEKLVDLFIDCNYDGFVAEMQSNTGCSETYAWMVWEEVQEYQADGSVMEHLDGEASDEENDAIERKFLLEKIMEILP